MSEGGRHWNYGGVEGPSTRSLIQDRESARKPRRVLSKNDFSEENRQLISDDEIHTDLTHYRNSQSASYYHGDTGTDVEMEYMASDGEYQPADPPDFSDFGYVRQLSSTMTGRQRKKLAARSKGGEFQTRRKKRRVYFCCICSELDIENMYEFLLNDKEKLYDPKKGNWTFQVHADVLRMYRTSTASEGYVDEKIGVSEKDLSMGVDSSIAVDMKDKIELDTATRIGVSGTQEVFIYEFGSIVLWGFSRGEEEGIIKLIRKFAVKGTVKEYEFGDCEDDMAFVTSPSVNRISIGNDVITLPDETLAKQRLAVSYAIAQSTVLSLFESRIEKKMEEYKYIPETLAAVGSVHLEQTQLGKMIGEIFVIRHDVNLHSDILDTPDFFWEEDQFEPEYKMVMRYLEMDGRVEVVNKRLDLLRELLDVLQEQMENKHAVTLEWIVIWLIVVEIVIEVVSIVGQVSGLWNVGR